MISAISSISQSNNYKQSFTGVVPVRVQIDGKEVYSEKLVRPAVLKLASILAGPVKNNEVLLNIIRKFGAVDMDYSVIKGINGYPKHFGQKKVQPSDHFRYIGKRHSHYLLTGKQAEKLKELGKEVGHEKEALKKRGMSESLDLKVAQGNYFGTINEFIRKQSLRLTESFNPETHQRMGEPVSLVIHLSSNKKYGEKGFKMQLEDISFTKTS